MSIDPYRDMAFWLDMTPAEEARLRHPAGRARVPESPEVAQARMDREACQLASSNNPRPAPHPVKDLFTAIGAGFTVYGLICGMSLIGKWAAGWPA